MEEYHEFVDPFIGLSTVKRIEEGYDLKQLFVDAANVLLISGPV